MPPVQLTGVPPPQGRQYVIFDVPGQSVQVSELRDVAWARGTGTTSENLCVTPCVADLRIGEHQIMMGDTLTIQVPSDPLVVRHVPGANRDTRGTGAIIGGLISGILGVGAIASGGVIAPVGAATGSPGAEEAGLVTLGSGAVLFGLAVYLFSGNIYVTPGATTQWTLPALPPAPERPAATLQF